MSARIRLATESDAPAVQAVYAPYVQSTAISFELEPPSVDEMRERIHKTLAMFPWLVYETAEGEIAGYVYAGKHRERAAYQWSVDTAVYLDSRFHRMGIGRALYTSLFELLRLQGVYNAYAGATLPNSGSVGLHESLGFQPVGVYKHVGYKMGKWHDVMWWSLDLLPMSDTPEPPRPIASLIGTPAYETALNAGLQLVKG